MEFRADLVLELAVLSAVAHGNKPNGLAVVQAALVALARLDREHAAVYFQIIWNGLRERLYSGLWRRWSWNGRPKARQNLLDRWVDNVLGAKTASDVLPG